MIIGSGVIGAKPKFPEVMGSITGASTGAYVSSFAAPLPAGIAAGEMLVLMVGMSAPTANAPGWTQLFSVQQPSGSLYATLVCIYKTATGLEGSSVLLSASGPVCWSTVACRIKGASSIEAAAGAGGVSTVTDPPSLSPSYGARKTLWMAAAATSSPGTRYVAGPPSGYSGFMRAIGSVSTGATVSIASAWRQAEVATENPGAMAFNEPVTVLAIANTIAIRPK